MPKNRVDSLDNGEPTQNEGEKLPISIITKQTRKEKIMKSGIATIIARAKITRHTQEDLKSSWIWNEMTLDQWDNEIADLQRMQEMCSSAKFARDSSRAAL
jgi:hypothetical protein